MQTNRLGEHAALDVATFPHKVVRGVCMTRLFNILMDDRPFVEICRNIMRRCACPSSEHLAQLAA